MKELEYKSSSCWRGEPGEWCQLNIITQFSEYIGLSETEYEIVRQKIITEIFQDYQSTGYSSEYGILLVGYYSAGLPLRGGQSRVKLTQIDHEDLSFHLNK